MTWTVFVKMLKQMLEASGGTLILFFLTLLLALPLRVLWPVLLLARRRRRRRRRRR